MLDVIKAIGALALIGVLWIAIPIAGVAVGITFAAYLVFAGLLNEIKGSREE